MTCKSSRARHSVIGAVHICAGTQISVDFLVVCSFSASRLVSVQRACQSCGAGSCDIVQICICDLGQIRLHIVVGGASRTGSHGCLVDGHCVIIRCIGIVIIHAADGHRAHLLRFDLNLCCQCGISFRINIYGVGPCFDISGVCIVECRITTDIRLVGSFTCAVVQRNFHLVIVRTGGRRFAVQVDPMYCTDSRLAVADGCSVNAVPVFAPDITGDRIVRNNGKLSISISGGRKGRTAQTYVDLCVRRSCHGICLQRNGKSCRLVLGQALACRIQDRRLNIGHRIDS